MILNEFLKRYLKKFVIVQGYFCELFFKGNKLKMGRKQNIKDEDESSRNFKEGQERKFQNELMFVNIIKDKMDFLKRDFLGSRKNKRGLVCFLS